MRRFLLLKEVLVLFPVTVWHVLLSPQIYREGLENIQGLRLLSYSRFKARWYSHLNKFSCEKGERTKKTGITHVHARFLGGDCILGPGFW